MKCQQGISFRFQLRGNMWQVGSSHRLLIKSWMICQTTFFPNFSVVNWHGKYWNVLRPATESDRSRHRFIQYLVLWALIKMKSWFRSSQRNLLYRKFVQRFFSYFCFCELSDRSELNVYRPSTNLFSVILEPFLIATSSESPLKLQRVM